MFLHTPRLAQRLLCRLSLMLACAATSGCLWPTSLTDAVTDNTAVRPVFVPEKVKPAFGDLPSSPGMHIELNLSAEDPNGDGDVLHVRLFKKAVADSGRVYTGQEFPINRQPGSDVFSGPSQSLDLCGLYGDGTELFVVVSDAPFFNDAGEEASSNGLTSENQWTLRCQ
jgi:hypothetical protein